MDDQLIYLKWCDRCEKKINETGHVCFDQQPPIKKLPKSPPPQDVQEEYKGIPMPKEFQETNDLYMEPKTYEVKLKRRDVCAFCHQKLAQSPTALEELIKLRLFFYQSKVPDGVSDERKAGYSIAMDEAYLKVSEILDKIKELERK